MTELRSNFVVAASADAVWDVVGRRFDRIGEWSTAIPASTALPAKPHAVDVERRLPVPNDVVEVPVAGRVCQTGVHLVPQVTETLVAYNDALRTLTYEGSGMPSFVTHALNTWTVTTVDEHTSRVSLQAQFETRGLLGRLARLAILTQVKITSRHLADDLSQYVLFGRPSARKQAQLHRARRQRA